MSSTYQPKRKELAKVEAISSELYSKNRKKFKFVGSIQRSCTNFITTKRNKKTGRCAFVDDTSSLTKRSKNDVVNFFLDAKNKRKDVVYLVLPIFKSSKPAPENRNKIEKFRQ